MKHIKEFENVSNIKDLKFNVGDYVVIDIDQLTTNNIENNWNDSPKNKYAILVSIEEFDDNFPFPYYITFFDGSEFQLKEDEIKRLMTKEEIEEFELLKNSNTYNL